MRFHSPNGEMAFSASHYTWVQFHKLSHRQIVKMAYQSGRNLSFSSVSQFNFSAFLSLSHILSPCLLPLFFSPSAFISPCVWSLCRVIIQQILNNGWVREVLRSFLLLRFIRRLFLWLIIMVATDHEVIGKKKPSIYFDIVIVHFASITRFKWIGFKQ